MTGSFLGMLRDRWTSGPWGRTRAATSAATLVCLATLATFGEGVPTLATCFLVAVLLGGLLLAGLVATGRFPPRSRGPAALALGGVLAVLVLWLVQGAAPLQLGWVTLVAVPLALHGATTLAGMHFTAPLRVAWALTLALGLVQTQPWNLAHGNFLLGVLALLLAAQWCLAGLAGAAGSESSRRLRRVPVLPGLRLAALVAALILLASAALFAGFERLPAVFYPGEREELVPLDAAPTEAELMGIPPPPPAPPDKVVARVRIEGQSTRARPDLEVLYLRAFVLDRPGSSGTFAYLERAQGPAEVRDDAADGTTDQRVDVTTFFRKTEPTRLWRSEVERLLRQEVTLLDRHVPALLLQPEPVSVEGEALTLHADSSIDRRGGDHEAYRVVSRVSDYLAEKSARAAAAEHPGQLELPADLPERRGMQQRMRQFLSDPPNDLRSARLFWRQQRARAQLPDLPAWNGSYLDLLDGKVTGTSLEYAQAFALAARTAGLPARVAVGYRAHEWNAESSAFEARVRDFAAWPELEFEELGWVGFDFLPLPAEEEGPAQLPPEPERGTGSEGESPEELAAADPAVPQGPAPAPEVSETQTSPFLILAFLALAVALAALFLRRPRAERGEAQRARPAKLPRSARQAWKYWRQFVALCERAGWHQEDGATAREFARDVAAHVGPEQEGLGLLVDSYYRCRFGGEPLPRPRERQLQDFLQRLPRQLIARPADARRSTR